jgi:ABC-type antimicrobial peptide transport system permease subunit
MLKDLCRAGVEGMTDMSGSTAGRREIYKDLIASILSFIIAILIVAFVGKWLWNTTVAELFTFVRPVRSVWQIIGLMLFISLVK